jgi:hypothetical protein
VKLLTTGDLVSCNKIARGQKTPLRAGVDNLDARLARRLMDARPPNVQTFSGVTIMKARARRLLLGALAAVSAALLTSQLHAQSLRAAPNATPASEEGITEVLAFLNRDAAGNLARGAAPLVHPVQGVISISPDTVDSGGPASVTFSTSGFFDLSQIRIAQIGIRPGNDITNLKIERQTAQHLTLSFQVAGSAATGVRTLFITNSQDDTVVALDLTINLGANVCNPACTGSQVCRNNVCVAQGGGGGGIHQCSPACGEDTHCVNGRCVDFCNPHCSGATPFCVAGRCSRIPPP